MPSLEAFCFWAVHVFIYPCMIIYWKSVNTAL